MKDGQVSYWNYEHGSCGASVAPQGAVDPYRRMDSHQTTHVACIAQPTLMRTPERIRALES